MSVLQDQSGQRVEMAELSQLLVHMCVRESGCVYSGMCECVHVRGVCM